MSAVRSFRGRLLLVALATLAGGLAVLLVTGNVLLASGVRGQVTSELRNRSEAELAALDIRAGRIVVRETPNDAVLDARSWVLEGRRVIERPPNAAADLDRDAVALGRSGRTGEHDGPDGIRLRADAIRDPADRRAGTVVVAFSVESLERLQRGVLFGSLVLAILVLAAGTVAIRAAVDGALRPVARMTATAEDWGAHDLERRFDLGPPRDELTGLAATLDGLLTRIAASRRHEQRFASEVAHELRTPLAGMRGRAELALDAGTTPEQQAEALRTVVVQTQRLQATIDTLVALARRELDPAAGTVDLAELLAGELVEGLAVHVEPGLPHAEGEPDVVRRALQPLLDNARRFARERVTVTVARDAGSHVAVTVRDDGPGFDPALGDRVFEPGVRGDASGAAGSGGAGLGLPLARRLARSCGGDVELGDGPGGCVVLRLPAVGS